MIKDLYFLRNGNQWRTAKNQGRRAKSGGKIFERAD